jgi:hypothetical protein
MQSGEVMEIGIHANMSDQATSKVAAALRPLFRELSNRLKGEYGGLIEHLWIDLELIESHAKTDGKPRYPFRFQKRVSGHSHFGLPPVPDKFNVGHFSVRPDFALISSLPSEQAIPHVLSLIYKASAVLLDKQKKLGGFNAELFRARFQDECQNLGYQCET